jgi:hypothetical protein
MKHVGRALAVGLVVFAGAAHAEIANGKVKIGVLTDLSGAYEQNSGNGSVEAAKMAAEEFGNKVNGKPIEIVAGDHQNKPDVGAALANRWFDVDKVDAVTDLVNSAVGFAVLDIAKQKNKAVLLTSAGSADFTGKACAPNISVHWVYDTYEIGSAIGRAVPQLGKTWYFITADYIFGKMLQDSVKNAVEKNGGKVVGSVSHPLGATDYSSYVLQAQASKADVVAINNGGDDGVNAVKAANEIRYRSRRTEGRPVRARLAARDQERRPRKCKRHDVRDALDARVDQGVAGLHAEVHRAPKNCAFYVPRRHLFGGPQLSQGGGSHRLDRPQSRARQDAREPGQGRLHRQWQAAAGRPHGA